MSSKQLEIKQEAARDTEIAKQLGITCRELGETTYEIEERSGNDGYLYSYYIRFDNNSPKKILDKIEGLNNFCIDIELNDPTF